MSVNQELFKEFLRPAIIGSRKFVDLDREDFSKLFRNMFHGFYAEDILVLTNDKQLLKKIIDHYVFAKEHTNYILINSQIGKKIADNVDFMNGVLMQSQIEGGANNSNLFVMAKSEQDLKIVAAEFFECHVEKCGIELYTSGLDIEEVPAFRVLLNVNDSLRSVYNNGLIGDNFMMDNFMFLFDTAIDGEEYNPVEEF